MGKKFYCDECGDEISEDDENICDECFDAGKDDEYGNNEVYN